MSYTPASPVFARSTLTAAQFAVFLRAKRSPAAIEAAAIYGALVSAGVDPAVALGQFGAESSFGTAGYAKTTRNWGNIVISRPALPHWSRAFGGRPWKAPNGRTYAAFRTWRDGARAYAALLKTYKLRGWARSIESMCRKWLGGIGTGYINNIVRIANSTAGRPAMPPPAPVPAPAPPKPVVPPINLIPEHLPSTQPPGDGSFAKYGWTAEWEAGWSPYGAWVARPVVFPNFPNPPAKPTVYVLVHGGPLPLDTLAGMDNLAGWIAARGGIGVAIKYPMIREEDVWDGTFRDGVGAIQSAIAKGRATGAPVVLVGHSAGGLFLSLAAFGAQVGPLPDRVIYIAADDVVGEGWRASIGAPDPRSLYGANKLPVTVIVGSGDLVTTVAEGQAMVTALNAAGHPGRWLVIDNAGHSDILSDVNTINAITGG